MTRILDLQDAIFGAITRVLGDWFIPTFARFTFAATLLIYFWNSAVTKLGDGFFGFITLSDNVYFQMFPKAVEAADYDTSSLGIIYWVIGLFGTWAEFILPLLIILGLFTRLAALGMIGFVSVQSFVDVNGHGVGGADLGAWFDGPSGSLIMDQRLFWVFVLMVLLVKGAGRLSLDHVLGRSTG